MSLPYLFGTRIDTIPTDIPYVFPPESLISRWKSRLSGFRKLLVGVVWGGSRALAGRSLELPQLLPLLETGEIQVISLQKGSSPLQFSSLGRDIPDWMEECGDFLETAALIQNLDIVVSIDTAVAHLAGALGKPVWLLAKYESDWRWGLERSNSPWYPTMRIFRQPRSGDWDTIIQEVSIAIAGIARDKPAGLNPQSTVNVTSEK